MAGGQRGVGFAGPLEPNLDQLVEAIGQSGLFRLPPKRGRKRPLISGSATAPLVAEPLLSGARVATHFKDEHLTDAERSLQVLRRDLEEIREAIREAEQLIADSERQGLGLLLKD